MEATRTHQSKRIARKQCGKCLSCRFTTTGPEYEQKPHPLLRIIVSNECMIPGNLRRQRNTRNTARKLSKLFEYKNIDRFGVRKSCKTLKTATITWPLIVVRSMYVNPPHSRQRCVRMHVPHLSVKKILEAILRNCTYREMLKNVVSW